MVTSRLPDCPTSQKQSQPSNKQFLPLKRKTPALRH
ncbi:uncharacterized protein GLRG_06836 [Colletotrichum graminicola M1.001]|uniref:Uncharacterized protein n=1 Tax=Colletotrichum graminicola (strain M1.001 / M2 / FGSC 10212) TaxID=645133 RepID=E3QL09_COLGM|nr:uncharacterized protein GLRG_06836 [Colletotrichum graminicola M1.001]EFQ31547.1 hypothetical protein GLRG_06836 [Colletotrichum graminicola M1.001]